jgi:hypothetical protein
MRLESKRAIVERLGNLAEEGIRVEDSARSNVPKPKARVTVYYEGSSSQTPRMNRPVLQERTVRFRVNVQLEDLRTYDQILPILDRVDDCLTGFEPLGKGSMYHVSDEVVEVQGRSKTEEGDWAYSMLYAFPVAHKQTENKLI